jgi:hypothetical protein
MAQERHPPSKAFKSELFFKMQKNKDGSYMFILFTLCTFPYVGISLSKLAAQMVNSTALGNLFKETL